MADLKQLYKEEWEKFLHSNIRLVASYRKLLKAVVADDKGGTTSI